MNKGDLINEVSVVMNSKKDAQKAVDAVFWVKAHKGTKRDIGFSTFQV